MDLLVGVGMDRMFPLEHGRGRTSRLPARERPHGLTAGCGRPSFGVCFAGLRRMVCLDIGVSTVGLL